MFLNELLKFCNMMLRSMMLRSATSWYLILVVREKKQSRIMSKIDLKAGLTLFYYFVHCFTAFQWYSAVITIGALAIPRFPIIINLQTNKLTLPDMRACYKGNRTFRKPPYFLFLWNHTGLSLSPKSRTWQISRTIMHHNRFNST